MKSAHAWALPDEPEALAAMQCALAAANVADWRLPSAGLLVGGCFAAFARGGEGAGARGDPGWGGAALVRGGRVVCGVAVEGCAGGPYLPGLLALREGPLLVAAVRALPVVPDVLLVNATGRDHARGAGMAVHLGALLGCPSIGVTDRPLLAEGPRPGADEDAASLLRLDGREVAAWIRARSGVRPLVVHPGWRTDLATALAVIHVSLGRGRTPLPIVEARRRARTAREEAQRRSREQAP